jgi:hypothetical protein
MATMALLLSGMVQETTIVGEYDEASGTTLSPATGPPGTLIEAGLLN